MSNRDVAAVFYINLDFRIDRNEHVIRQLVACPWPYYRISAVRLASSPDTMGIKLRSDMESMPHVASIFLSHRKALQAMSDFVSDGTFILLEDDVHLHKDFFGQRPLFPTDDGAEDWDICLVSVRYKTEDGCAADGSSAKMRWSWAKNPFGSRVVSSIEARANHIVTGAHCCLINGKAAARRIVDKMEKTKVIYDVDIWYLQETLSYVWYCPLVGTEMLGSNHADRLS